MGSHNWPSAAEERNDENVVVIRSPEVARRFEREFLRVWGEAGEAVNVSDSEGCS